LHRKQHVVITYMFFKKGYDEVHAWIDNTYRPNLGYLHWLNRHHIQAIKEKYGEDTVEYKVAFLHIMCDFLSHLGLFIVPKNREDCLNIFKDLGIVNDDWYDDTLNK
jgi:hypothetical protein